MIYLLNLQYTWGPTTLENEKTLLYTETYNRLWPYNTPTRKHFCLLKPLTNFGPTTFQL